MAGSLPQIWRKLFENNGQGPNIKSGIIPIDNDTIILNDDNKLAAKSKDSVTLAQLIAAMAGKLDTDIYVANNTYAISEYDTGKRWVDGKTIYCKVVNGGNMPNATSKNVAHNIANLERVVSLTGMLHRPTQGQWVSFPYATVTTYLLLAATSANVQFITSSGDFTTYTGLAIIEYTCTDR